jgi:hypothetical protein
VLLLADDLPPLPPEAELPAELPPAVETPPVEPPVVEPPLEAPALAEELEELEELPPEPPDAPPDLDELLDPPDEPELPAPPPELELDCPPEEEPPDEDPPLALDPPELVLAEDPLAPPALALLSPPEFDEQPAAARQATRARLVRRDVVCMGGVLFLPSGSRHGAAARRQAEEAKGWPWRAGHVYPDRTTPRFGPTFVMDFSPRPVDF